MRLHQASRRLIALMKDASPEDARQKDARKGRLYKSSLPQ